MVGGSDHARVLEEARRAWPDFDVPEERFSAALARVEAPLAVNAADLYLAQACLLGLRRALDVFERQILPQITPSVARVCGKDLSLDEVLQTTREKLLVGGPNKQPKLAQYTGEGPLVGWLRVVAVRDALAQRRLKSPRQRSLSDETRLVPSTPSNAHISLLRRTHAQDFKEAVEEGIRELSIEQRNLLRMNVLDGMNIDQLAALFQIHRATAARRLQRARELVLERAQQKLKKKLNLSDSEIGSLCDDLASQIDLSLSRALGNAEGAT